MIGNYIRSKQKTKKKINMGIMVGSSLSKPQLLGVV
jgi:hypothetical protein